MNKTKYINLRKAYLITEAKLVCERDKISNELRKLRIEMRGWDRALVRIGV